MTKNNNVNSAALFEQLEGIKKYLKRYEKKLFKLMESLEAGENLDGETKTLEAVIGRLDKVAYKFFEVGCKLDEFKAQEDKTGVLDTHAAKEEILRRLDRIQASQAIKADD